MKVKTYFFVFLGLVIFVGGYLFLGIENGKMSPELSITNSSFLGKSYGKVVAASCGFPSQGHGSADEATSCTYMANCCYGGPVQTTGTNVCGGGTCSGGTPACATHPDFGKACTNTNGCGVVTTGTIDKCGVCNAPINNPATCTKTNVCGQTFSGYQCSGGCTVSSSSGNINDSCISNFNVSTSQVNPNGSVEFSWKLPTTTSATCGFVDLTTPTPRLIPGLQNLDVNTDRIRISNIQVTTRFCLVCQFTNLLNGLTGTGQTHQWIRVIRTGEN